MVWQHFESIGKGSYAYSAKTGLESRTHVGIMGLACCITICSNSIYLFILIYKVYKYKI